MRDLLPFLIGVMTAMALRKTMRWNARMVIRRTLMGAGTAYEAREMLREIDPGTLFSEVFVLSETDPSEEVRRTARAFLRYIS